MHPDFRILPERRELSDLMYRVESLGASCELGLVQRHCGADSMGLFRFGFTPFDGLVQALNANLNDVGEASDIQFKQWPNLEYISLHRKYGFECHTGHFADRISEDEMREKMAVHFKFLARKLIGQLSNNEKLFVYRPENPGRHNDARILLDAMSKYGDPVLMWVDLDPVKAGTVEWMLPGKIMIGYLDSFASVNYAAAMPFDNWVNVIQLGLELQGIAADVKAERL
jgi:hypothetical protein